MQIAERRPPIIIGSYTYGTRVISREYLARAVHIIPRVWYGPDTSRTSYARSLVRALLVNISIVINVDTIISTISSAAYTKRNSATKKRIVIQTPPRARRHTNPFMQSRKVQESTRTPHAHKLSARPRDVSACSYRLSAYIYLSEWSSS